MVPELDLLVVQTSGAYLDTNIYEDSMVDVSL
jgi:hypothetical protein